MKTADRLRKVASELERKASRTEVEQIARSLQGESSFKTGHPHDVLTVDFDDGAKAKTFAQKAKKIRDVHQVNGPKFYEREKTYTVTVELG